MAVEMFQHWVKLYKAGELVKTVYKGFSLRQASKLKSTWENGGTQFTAEIERKYYETIY